MTLRTTNGFTLVELLVSVVILFSVVSTMSLIYSGAYKSSEKATQYVELAGAIPGILEQTRFYIQQAPYFENEIVREGTNGNVEYFWVAKMRQTRVYSNSPKANEFGVSNMDGNEYKLWSVKLTVEIDSVVQVYTFHEVSWRDR